MGYREADGIEAKMRRSEGGVEREDVEDEAPTVVVLNKGDLTEEEVTLVLCVYHRAPVQPAHPKALPNTTVPKKVTTEISLEPVITTHILKTQTHG